jgi:hypothetical protein
LDYIKYHTTGTADFSYVIKNEAKLQRWQKARHVGGTMTLNVWVVNDLRYSKDDSSLAGVRLNLSYLYLMHNTDIISTQHFLKTKRAAWTE